METEVKRREDEWSKPSLAIFPWFQDLLRERLNKRFNVVVLFVGMAGVGKSYNSMTLCEEMDRNFPEDASRVCFTHKEVFKQVDTMKKKEWLIIDEPALSGILSKRSWMEEAQQALVDLIESFRFKNLGVCFNTISAQLLDKTVRELLCHYMCWVIERGYAKVYAIEPSQFRTQVRTPYCGDAYFDLPSDNLMKAYEHKRAKFIKSRYFRSLTQIEMKESAHLGFKDIIEKAKEHVEELRNSEGDIDVINIQEVLSVGKDRSYHVKRKLKQLGIT
jgi:hypothetical protein